MFGLAFALLLASCLLPPAAAADLESAPGEIDVSPFEEDSTSQSRNFMLGETFFVSSFLPSASVDVPVGVADSYVTLGFLSVPAPGVMANDVLPSSGTWVPEVVTGPTTEASLTLFPDGGLSYRAGGYLGLDEFTYHYINSDTNEMTDPVPVRIRVGDNILPVAVDDSYTLPADAPFAIPVESGVLSNDSDPDGDPLIASLSDSPPPFPTFDFSFDGSFSGVTPALAVDTTYLFHYRASDTPGSEAEAQVSITVMAAGPPTDTPTNTATSSPTASPTNSPTNTTTNTPTSTPSNTPTMLPSSTPTNTVTNTPTATATVTLTSTATSTATASPTDTPLPPTSSPTQTATATSSNTATNTATPTNTATTTPTTTQTATMAPTSTSTNTSTPSPTSTPTSTAVPSTNAPTAMATNTAIPTSTSTLTPTQTATATETAMAAETATATQSSTSTATDTATNSPTSTATATPSATLTLTPSSTPTITSTSTSTPSPTPIATQTSLPTVTATLTQTPTETATNIPTNTPTRTPTATATPAPAVSMNPQRATVNSWIHYSLVGYRHHATVTIKWRRLSGSELLIGTIVTDSVGAASGKFRVPATPGGPGQKITFSSGNVAKTLNVEVAPRIKVLTSPVARGKAAEVSLRGYAKNEIVRIRWEKGDGWGTIATVVTSNTGSANLFVTVPIWAPNGFNSVRGDGTMFRQQTNVANVQGGPYTPTVSAIAGIGKPATVGRTSLLFAAPIAPVCALVLLVTRRRSRRVRR